MDLQHPAKVATAAVLASLAVMPLGGFVDDYAYYAPLGAVIAVTATVVGSARESLQTIVAIACGALLAAAVVPLPQLLGLVLVVGLGSLAKEVPGLRRVLGDSGTWVPLSGMFVLVIGGDSMLEYATAYLGLTTYGAVIGLAVSALWPPLLLQPMGSAVRDLRGTLAEQLDGLAEALGGEHPPTGEEWEDYLHPIEPTLVRMRHLVARAGESRRVNWRAGRWRQAAERVHRQTQALERIALLVEDLTDLLHDHERAEREHVALGPELRPHASRVLEDLAAALRANSGDGQGDDPQELVARATASTDALVEAMRDTRSHTGDDLLTAAGMVTAVRRALDVLTPAGDDSDH